MNLSVCKQRFLHIICGIIFIIFLLYKFPKPGNNANSMDTIETDRNNDEYNCGCRRHRQEARNKDGSSLCSGWASSRGENQSVIAYTIYGDYWKKNIWKHYYDQIENRLKEITIHYKGWIVRLYHKFDPTDVQTHKLLCKLYCKYPNLDPCDINKIRIPDSWLDEFKSTFNDTRTPHRTPFFNRIISYINSLQGDIKFNTNDKIERIKNGENNFGKLLPGKIWRFLPLGDSLVDKFLVRDVDSYILPREVAAVDQWLTEYGTLIHAMRDHPSHNGLILAGLWGALRRKGEEKLTKFLKEMVLSPTRDVWDYDQTLLREIVWPHVLNQIVIHDSYHCRSMFLTNKQNIILAFPTQRHGKMFVSWGPTRSKTELDILKPCPVACRPKNHQNWEYC